MYLQLSSAARNPMLCLGIYHFPYFVDTTKEGSGESAQMCRLTWPLVVRQCISYINPMYF